MLLFILWRDTTSELWTPVQFIYIDITILHLLALFTFLRTITFYHSIRLIHCSQQTGEIDNLIVSWGKVLGCVVCRFHVDTGEKLHADKYPGAIVRSVAKLAGINLRKCGFFSYWFDKPWFHNWGKTCCCAHHNLALGVFQLVFGVNYTPANNNQTPLVNCGPRSILLHCYYRLLFTHFIYILANYYLLSLDTLNPLFTANRWDWQPHCDLG
jgi:hypothetical protein